MAKRIVDCNEVEEALEKCLAVGRMYLQQGKVQEIVFCHEKGEFIRIPFARKNGERWLDLWRDPEGYSSTSAENDKH